MTQTAVSLARRIADLALDKKGSDVCILDLRGISSVTDYFVIISGDATPHLDSIAGGIEDGLRTEGTRLIGKEGIGSGRWILLDYFDVVAHIFYRPVREFYALEKLWGDAPRELAQLEEDTPQE